MTGPQFRAAFMAISDAIKYPRDRKPKNMRCATSGYARGWGAKREHIEELQSMTLEEVYEMAYALRDNQ